MQHLAEDLSQEILVFGRCLGISSRGGYCRRLKNTEDEGPKGEKFLSCSKVELLHRFLRVFNLKTLTRHRQLERNHVLAGGKK